MSARTSLTWSTRISCLSTRFVLLLALLSCGMGITNAADSESKVPARLDYPEARRGGGADDYNGVKVRDPYRLVEGLNSEQTHQGGLAHAHLAGNYFVNIALSESRILMMTKILTNPKIG